MDSEHDAKPRVPVGDSSAGMLLAGHEQRGHLPPLTSTMEVGGEVGGRATAKVAFTRAATQGDGVELERAEIWKPRCLRRNV